MLQNVGNCRVELRNINAGPQLFESSRSLHQALNPIGLVELVRETGMATVVKQAGQADHLGHVINRIQLLEGQFRLAAELAFTQIGVHHGAEHTVPHVHHPDAVKEARVRGARKDQAEDVILADVAQALEKAVINDVDLMTVQPDSAMNRVHDQFVVGTEQVIQGTSHNRAYRLPKLRNRARL